MYVDEPEGDINTPEEDSTLEHPTEGTDTPKTSSEEDSDQTTEHPGTEEGDETSVDWQKRYRDLQAETVRVQQEVAEFKKGSQTQATQQDWKKYQEERQKRLDVGTYMEQFKENPSEGLNQWARAREGELTRSVQGMIGGIGNQTQLNTYRLMKILSEIAPEVVEKHLEKEKAMKKVLDEVPALYNFPNYLEQAEKMALAGMKGKDLKEMQKDMEKKIKKSMEQKSGVSIPTTKAPGKGTKTKEERYKDYVIGKGRRSTIL